MEYAAALELQRELQLRVIESRETGAHAMTVLLVEHDPPVITISRRPGAARHLVANDTQLRTAGVTVAPTDRGGDITCHGPGQLVAYPILDLNVLNLRLNGYLRFLEQVIIDTLAPFGIDGHRDPAATGVWVHSPHASTPKPQASKIAAIGVRVTRWVTMHGLALNVTTNLDHFDLIVPCGLTGRSVTSMQQVLGNRCPGMDAVKQAFSNAFGNAIERPCRSRPIE